MSLALRTPCRRLTRYLHTRHASSTANSIEDLKSEFRPFAGGSVDLRINDSSNGIASVVLSHPERKNALSGRMMAELHDAAQELVRWAQRDKQVARGWVLRADTEGEAEGKRFFCSGGALVR